MTVNTMRNALRSVCFWLCFVVLSPVLATTQAKAAKNDIIYEYEIITQKKGQSLSAALKAAKLSAYQANLVGALPIRTSTPEPRQLRLSYVLKNGKRLLREVKVSRGNRQANFVLTGTPGNHQFVSKASEIPKDKLKSAPKLTSLGSAVSLTSTKESLKSMTIAQTRGQSLDEALRPLKLSKTQKQIVKTGDFAKSALTKRDCTLYFAGNRSKKLLRGMTVERGGKRVDYIVESKEGAYQLRNLKTVDGSQRKSALARFEKAKKWSVKPIQLASTNASTGRAGAKASDSEMDSGKYRLLRVTQKKGQTLWSAMKAHSLTSEQRNLISQIPVTKSAKSTRHFYLLFEKNGRKKYLKAVRVARGGLSAEYVLAKNSGRWAWANSKGQVKSSSGFLRYPLNYSRITSGFNLRRRHPVTRRIRPHKGTDFKAPHGTPIWAPANGVVTFAGRQRGYGITLVIDHGNGYKTKYAHLSRILPGARKGKRVKKRQTIARVGNTGISTGTHLHYEVIVNGRARNPMTVKLPGGSGSKTLASAKKSAELYLPQIRRMIH